LYILNEKYLYENLNKMKLDQNIFVGVFWLPTSEVKNLKKAIRVMGKKKRVKTPQIYHRKEHELIPPTFIRTNEFTTPFQEITDTYGVPNYKEVNPSYF